jgi:hypothetical protein
VRRWHDDLKRGDQAAHIYNNEEEQARVVTDMISWMQADERLVLVSDRWHEGSEFARSRLLDVAMDDGHMDVIPGRHTLCPRGQFRPEVLRDIIDYELGRALDDGHAGLVMMWDLEWLSENPEVFESHIVQQVGMAMAPRRSNLTLMGQYGTSWLSNNQVDRVARVNPLVLQDGMLSRQFWLVSNSSLGRPGGRRTMQIAVSRESARTDPL